jgi:hypothetical protein
MKELPTALLPSTRAPDDQPIQTLPDSLRSPLILTTDAEWGARGGEHDQGHLSLP